MEKTTKRHHVPIDERVKDIHKDSVKLLYNSIINSMKEREVKATELETKKRMRCILWLAADADVLVLGRWGCGAFGNDWEVFKKWWDEVIEEERLMAEVDKIF